jgi:hypothetical protein
MVGELDSTVGVEVVVVILIPELEDGIVVEVVVADGWLGFYGWVGEVNIIVWSESILDGADTHSGVGADRERESFDVVGVVGIIDSPDAVIVDACLPSVVENVGIIKFAFIVMDHGIVEIGCFVWERDVDMDVVKATFVIEKIGVNRD